MSRLEVRVFRTEGLGDSTYLLTFDGLAALVDPQRDFERFLDDLGGADLRWVLETHVHNDYVSGGLAVSKATGAELVFPAAAAPVFRHTPAFHGEELVEGGLTIRPLHTPGHTPEHTSYLVLVDGRPQAVFTGGSLLVGSAGRSDLLGMPRAETLARLQFGSVRRLSRLPDETELFPTHGAGSFCTASRAGATTSTIGQEKRSNPVLAITDEDDFVATHLSGLQPYPTYYARMAPLNLQGGPALEPRRLPNVEYDDVPEGATLVDLRPADRHARGHYPGSVNIPLSDQFGTWFGWLIPPDSEVYLVADDEKQVAEAQLQLGRIGIDDLAGVLAGDGQGASETNQVATAKEVPTDGQVLDVRAPDERDLLAPEGTVHRYLPDLTGDPIEMDPSRPVWVVCAGGYRSAIAASLLRRRGFDAIPVIEGGVADLR